MPFLVETPKACGDGLFVPSELLIDVGESLNSVTRGARGEERVGVVASVVLAGGMETDGEDRP